MKLFAKIIATLAILVLIPLIIGAFLPKERIVENKIMIDTMYFYVLSDVTNHWEENKWRNNIDTLIQGGDVDGQEIWVEHYTNGDSVVLATQRATETDYIRIIHDDGKDRVRSITLVDVNGKTAIRMAEEVYESNPLKRFANLIYDYPAEHIILYLADLKEKNKINPNTKED